MLEVVSGQLSLVTSAGTAASKRRRGLDISVELGRIREGLRPLLEQEDAELEIDVPDGVLLRTEMRPETLASIVNVLVRNSLEWRGDGRKLRMIAAIRDAGDSCEIQFSDNGQGVLAMLEDKLFEPGISGHDGAGMGLTIARNIVNAHGGSITPVFDRRRKGATFRVVSCQEALASHDAKGLMTKRSATVVDLFSGAGGLSLGFRAAGARILAAVDASEAAGRTFQQNFLPPATGDRPACSLGDEGNLEDLDLGTCRPSDTRARHPRGRSTLSGFLADRSREARQPRRGSRMATIRATSCMAASWRRRASGSPGPWSWRTSRGCCTCAARTSPRTSQRTSPPADIAWATRCSTPCGSAYPSSGNAFSSSGSGRTSGSFPLRRHRHTG